MKRSLVLMLGLMSSMAYASQSDAIVGKWQTFDDRSGAKRAIIQIDYNPKNQTYYGKIVKRTHSNSDAAALETYDTCKKCPAPFTNKPISGMVVLWDLKKSDNKKFPYKGGYIIDPTRGHVYNLEGQVSRSGKALKGRASLMGARGIGRKQTWLKVN